jgi:hypothetical protein
MKLLDVINEQRLDEIDMSPTNLGQIVAGIDARAGMEFEMIVPNVSEADEYWEPEPDYDQDERCRSFDQIKEFFYDGDHNGRRTVERLYDNLLENYLDSDWLSEKKQEAWGEAAHDAITSLVDRDYDSELRDQAAEEVSAKTPEFGVNADEFQEAVDNRYRELFDAKVDEILADMGREYDEAYEEWEENEWQDLWNDFDWQEEWLEHEGLETMSNVADNYDINWPYWTEQDSDGNADIERVADEFSHAIGRKINWSSNYHGAQRAPDRYVVEPDGSLDADDSSDSGLEFVSPPLPLDELLGDLEKVKAWAADYGCYTNDSTGLHINVSVPGFSMEKLDYTKLALLLGDKYVLEQFGRLGNTYCKSALDIVKERIKQRPEDVSVVLDKMKQGLASLAGKVIHSGSTSKYTSINTKSGYIEFRSPGGDWLSEDFNTLKNTLYRFVVALDAALDETKYKQEYAKKLYKLLSPSNDSTDTLQYFARFSAGELPRSALASFVKQAQLQRKLKKGPTGAKYWWEVSNPSNSHASIEVVASSKEEAIERALQQDGYPSWANTRGGIVAKPLRPFDDGPVRASVGAPQPAGSVGNNRLSQTDIENRLGWGGQEADANYEVVDRSNMQPVFKFIANTPQEAARKYEQVLDVFGMPHETENYGFREIARPGSTLDLQRQRANTGNFTGQWKVIIDGEEVYRFSGAGNNQADANRIAHEWFMGQVRSGALTIGDGADITVVPVMQ